MYSGTLSLPSVSILCPNVGLPYSTDAVGIFGRRDRRVLFESYVYLAVVTITVIFCSAC